MASEVQTQPWVMKGCLVKLGYWVTECLMAKVALAAVVVKQHCWDCSLTEVNLEAVVQKQPWEMKDCWVRLGCWG